MYAFQMLFGLQRDIKEIPIIIAEQQNNLSREER